MACKKGDVVILKIGMIGIAAAFLAMPLKKEKSEFSILIGIAAGLVIFVQMLARISVVSDFIGSVLDRLPVEPVYFTQLLKMLGITYAADFSASVCRDAGYQSIAGQIEIFAKISILMLSLPGLAYILDILESFL